MVRSLVALVFRRVLALLLRSNEHAKDLEIVVLRHQLQVLRRHVGRPRFRWSDRLLIAAASCHLARETWRAFLMTPQTVLRWHRELVRRKWARGAGRRPGRPSILPALHQNDSGRSSGFRLSRRVSRQGRPPAALAGPDEAALWFRRRPRAGRGDGGGARGPRSVPGTS
jgi:hypothetical protein